MSYLEEFTYPLMNIQMDMELGYSFRIKGKEGIAGDPLIVMKWLMEGKEVEKFRDPKTQMLIDYFMSNTRKREAV